MTGEDIKSLRKELGCTAKDLAFALGTSQNEVLAWEKEELFPTKKDVDKMLALKSKGPSSVPKRAKAGAPAMKAFADPEFWELVRKLAAHKSLRDALKKIAANYSDPSEEES